jgi:uncharacterized membrane protein YccC
MNAVDKYKEAQLPTSDGYKWQTAEASLADAALAEQAAEIERLRGFCSEFVWGEENPAECAQQAERIRELEWMLRQIILEYRQLANIDLIISNEMVLDDLRLSYAEQKEVSDE